MTIVPYVCAEFHDRAGTAIYTIRPHQLKVLIPDAPESIRQDPLFNMLVADGSIVIPPNEAEKRRLEYDPDARAPGKAEEPGSPAPAAEAAGKASGRKTVEKK